MSLQNRKALFVLFGDPMMYPPTMNAASILGEHGWRVDIAAIRIQSGETIECPDNVNIVYFGEMRTKLLLRLHFILFILWLAMRSVRKRYDLVYAYDMMSVIPAFFASKVARCPWFYHNNDLMEMAQCKGFYYFIKKAELKLSRRASLVIFPQSERATIFQAEAGLDKTPVIVMNAPRKQWPDIPYTNDQIVEFRKRCGKVVLHQGGLSPRRGLDILIKAIPFFHKKTGLCLVGKELEQGYKMKALKLAKEMGVEDRLLILDVIPYTQLASITKTCDIGMAVPILPGNADCLNIRLLAGASNKVFEYMSCGLPVIAPDSSSYREIINPPEHGLLYDKLEPSVIAATIAELLSDLSLCREISQRNYRAFIEKYNYDEQFNKILQLISDNKTGRYSY